jgi:hypothetical protein
MSHPFLKISNNETDYFVVWDTYYELPLSIPMDLATFIMFLHEKKWTFTGLIASWNNLKNNNISLEGFVLNKYLKKNQYDFLLKQAEDEYVISKEINYREYSNLISSKLDTLFLKYQQKTINSSNEESKLLLAELHEEFHLYFNNDFCHNISLLPLHLYDNINSTCDKLYSQISSDKLNDFHNFLFSTQPNALDALRAAKWFSRQLFYYGLLWHEIPYFIRNKFTITNNNVVTNEVNSSFIRQVDKISVVELELTVHNLLSYFNHLIIEHYQFAIEIKTHFKEIGLLEDDNNFITLSNLSNFLNTDLLAAEILPRKLFNLSDNNGGMLLPSIYTDYYEDNGLIKFYKFDVQIIDIYSKNGDLIFTNLDDITIIKRENELLATFEERINGYKQYKKIIIQKGNPLEIQTVAPFNYLE